MTALAPTLLDRPRRPISRGAVMAASVGGALLMALVAVSFASLGVAFPIVLSLVERGAVSLAPGDLAASRSLAGLGWAFLLGGALHLLAAMGLLDSNRWLQRMTIAVSGVGLMFATMAASSAGPAVIIPASVYAAALSAAVLRRATA